MNEMYMTLALVTENKELEKRMNLIQKEMNGVLKSANVIGKALYEIKNQELWKDDYKSFEECASVFNIKKVQAYNLIKGYEVGEKKLVRNGEKADKISTLYSNTQCVELAKLKEDTKILDMLDSKKVTPDMTTKQIREIVDKELHPDKYTEPEEVEEVATDESTTDVDNAKTETSIILTIEYVAGELKINTDLQISANDIDKLKMLIGKYVAQ